MRRAFLMMMLFGLLPLACGEEQILNRSLGHGIGVGANDVPFIGIYPGVTGKDARKLEVGMVFSMKSDFSGSVIWSHHKRPTRSNRARCRSS